VLFFLILGSNLWFMGLWLKLMLQAAVKMVLDRFPAIKNRLKRTDGFDPGMYNSPKVVQSSYMEGGIKRFTLLRPRPTPEDNLDEIHCMLDVYREAFKHILEEEDFQPPQTLQPTSCSIETMEPGPRSFEVPEKDSIEGIRPSPDSIETLKLPQTILETEFE